MSDYGFDFAGPICIACGVIVLLCGGLIALAWIGMTWWAALIVTVVAALIGLPCLALAVKWVIR